jgi:hypothetical protein
MLEVVYLFHKTANTMTSGYTITQDAQTQKIVVAIDDVTVTARTAKASKVTWYSSDGKYSIVEQWLPLSQCVFVHDIQAFGPSRTRLVMPYWIFKEEINKPVGGLQPVSAPKHGTHISGGSVPTQTPTSPVARMQQNTISAPVTPQPKKLNLVKKAQPATSEPVQQQPAAQPTTGLKFTTTPPMKLSPLDLFIFATVDKSVNNGSVREWTKECAKLSGLNLIVK